MRTRSTSAWTAIAAALLALCVSLGAQQKFYKAWTVDDLLPVVKDLGTDHSEDQHRYDYREWFNRVNQPPAPGRGRGGQQ